MKESTRQGILLLIPIVVSCSVNNTPTSETRNSTLPQATTQNAQCDPNYSGCVPIASDVDCAGGGGNGPAYVKGPIRVIGRDIYQLDRDGDGIACE